MSANAERYQNNEKHNERTVDNMLFSPYHLRRRRRKEEGGMRNEEGGRRKEEGERRKEEGGRRKEDRIDHSLIR